MQCECIWERICVWALGESLLTLWCDGELYSKWSDCEWAVNSAAVEEHDRNRWAAQKNQKKKTHTDAQECYYSVRGANGQVLRYA